MLWIKWPVLMLDSLTSVASFEAAKGSREEARNLLEGYLYRLSGLLNVDADNRALHDFATEAERTTLSELLRASFEWLSDNAERADEASLRQKREALLKIENPIILRFAESRTRGKAVEDFQQAMFAARGFLTAAQKNNTIALESAAAAPEDKPVAPPKYTEDELKGVEEMLKDYEVWMDEKMRVQVKLEEDRTSDPVIMSKDLDDRGRRLQGTVRVD